jgi:hypothetical protein
MPLISLAGHLSSTHLLKSERVLLPFSRLHCLHDKQRLLTALVREIESGKIWSISMLPVTNNSPQ